MKINDVWILDDARHGFNSKLLSQFRWAVHHGVGKKVVLGALCVVVLEANVYV